MTEDKEQQEREDKVCNRLVMVFLLALMFTLWAAADYMDLI